MQWFLVKRDGEWAAVRLIALLGTPIFSRGPHRGPFESEAHALVAAKLRWR